MWAQQYDSCSHIGYFAADLYRIQPVRSILSRLHLCEQPAFVCIFSPKHCRSFQQKESSFTCCRLWSWRGWKRPRAKRKKNQQVLWKARSRRWVIQVHSLHLATLLSLLPKLPISSHICNHLFDQYHCNYYGQARYKQTAIHTWPDHRIAPLKASL